MEFVSNVDQMLEVAGDVMLLESDKGIQMELPEQMGESSISRIVFGTTKSGKRYIETIAMKDGNWPVYGEASIPEILVFAKKAELTFPDSRHTKELSRIAQKIKEVLDNT